jgi:hypothetical protein
MAEIEAEVWPGLKKKNRARTQEQARTPAHQSSSSPSRRDPASAFPLGIQFCPPPRYSSLQAPLPNQVRPSEEWSLSSTQSSGG